MKSSLLALTLCLLLASAARAQQQGQNNIIGSTYIIPATGLDTNLSNTITTGNTFQLLAAAKPGRNSFDFQNKSGNGDLCYLFFGASGATTANSIKVADGQEYLRSAGFIPSDAIWVTCQTTGDAFYFSQQ